MIGCDALQPLPQQRTQRIGKREVGKTFRVNLSVFADNSIGPIIGAFSVNGLKSWFTGAFPDLWLYALGMLFILVTLFMPQGILGLAAKIRRAREAA